LSFNIKIDKQKSLKELENLKTLFTAGIITEVVYTEMQLKLLDRMFLISSSLCLPVSSKREISCIDLFLIRNSETNSFNQLTLANSNYIEHFETKSQYLPVEESKDLNSTQIIPVISSNYEQLIGLKEMLTIVDKFENSYTFSQLDGNNMTHINLNQSIVQKYGKSDEFYATTARFGSEAVDISDQLNRFFDRSDLKTLDSIFWSELWSLLLLTYISEGNYYLYSD
jgi:hypothetical protein